MKNKCPWCGQTGVVKQCVWSNVENYGSTGGTVPCTKCGKIINVYAERTVILHSITKSDKTRDEADW